MELQKVKDVPANYGAPYAVNVKRLSS